MAKQDIELKITATPKTGRAYAEISRLTSKIAETVNTTVRLNQSSTASSRALNDFSGAASPFSAWPPVLPQPKTPTV
ncbi:hypothetical protein AGMMS49543_14140 [Betaproteobacteria bacterium]|nr:hypothetical protein AGMMS49543_14140 [Betaproteobacteria bacterium]GHU13949.1 hypothetical protein AGMMS50225_24860 [Betaproteobacteria bacterium]GHU20873.1 hypothetical protein AGMMS50243_17040 [Betaproteobacteria bacterium]